MGAGESLAVCVMAKRGLGSPKMDPAVKKAIAVAGGQAVQRKGTGHRFTSESGARAADVAQLNRLRKQAGVPAGDRE